MAPDREASWSLVVAATIDLLPTDRILAHNSLVHKVDGIMVNFLSRSKMLLNGYDWQTHHAGIGILRDAQPTIFLH